MTTLTDVEEELSAVDRDALDRAIDICRTKKDPADREQIERKLATEPWREVGEFAAYSCQMDSLHLQPWQLRRLLDAGLSRYEPDPIAALKAKKRPPRPSR